MTKTGKNVSFSAGTKKQNKKVSESKRKIAEMAEEQIQVGVEEMKEQFDMMR